MQKFVLHDSMVRLIGFWKSVVAICWIGNTLAHISGGMLQGILLNCIFFSFDLF